MNFDERYGWLDRLLFRVAFRAGLAQRTLSDVEDALYDDRLTPVDDPVFITSLPRSGTTILLRLLWQTGHFASHTYRDMPFVLCPMIWNRFSRSFATEDTARERAHGDGLEVSTTSPEAFEEMIWKHFWRDHYAGDRIRPWGPDDRNSEFDAFFERHMQKVVAVRRATARPDDASSLRYLSKNNLNIARLAAPPPPLRDGTFVVPFRDPVQQAASMHRQHQRFLEIHDRDDFVRVYMEAIGHHEFGRGLKPVDFDGWVDEAPDPNDLTFWLRYWIAAYRFVLRHADDSVVLVSYARLTDDPVPTLARLAESLSIPTGDLTALADDLRPPRTHEVDRDALPSDRLREADALYDRLDQRAVV